MWVHKGKPARPGHSLLELMKKEENKQEKDEEEVKSAK